MDKEKMETILAKHSQNYEKTVVKDEKSLYYLQVTGFEALNAMEDLASQLYTPEDVFNFIRHLYNVDNPYEYIDDHKALKQLIVSWKRNEEGGKRISKNHGARHVKRK